jgi:hypothetical protein
MVHGSCIVVRENNELHLHSTTLGAIFFVMISSKYLHILVSFPVEIFNAIDGIFGIGT